MEGYTFVEDRPPPCFTEQELDTLTARRRIAKASPLRKDTLLSFSLPSLYPKAVYDTSIQAKESPNTARHASQSLLKLLNDDKSGRLNVRLVKGIQKGWGELSQVWKGSIDVEGRRKKVVVKLFAEALFPLPRDIRDSGWGPASEVVHSEAEGYSAFRAEQGLSVPICYGFYQFDAPWGEKVIGVILEDLSEITIPLSTFAANFLKTGDGFSNESGPDYDSDEEEEEFEENEDGWEAYENKVKEDAVRKATQLKHFILELVKAHRRLQDLGLALPIFKGDHILLLRSSTLDKPKFVFTSIRRAMTREEAEREPARMTGQDFRGRGEELLTGVVEEVFGTKVLIEWERMELFPFVY